MDLTVGNTDAVPAIETVTEILHQLGPVAPTLVRLVKWLLSVATIPVPGARAGERCAANETYRGGLGSYAVTCLVCWYLLERRGTGELDQDWPSLGEALEGLLRLYGDSALCGLTKDGHGADAVQLHHAQPRFPA